MKKLVLALILVLAMAVPAFADSWHDQYNTTNNNQTYNQPTATSNSSATVTDNSKTYNTNTNLNTNINSNKAEANSTNINIIKADPRQGQGQYQGQGQNQINEGNKVDIKVEKPYMAAPSTNAPEVNFGAGKLNWGFNALMFGIPLYGKENIKSLIREKHNVKADDLIAVVLKMKEKEGVPTYNTRLLIMEKEAQKSYALSIIGSPAGSGTLGTTGVAGSAVVGPSFAGTKANNLYSVYFVVVEVKK